MNKLLLRVSEAAGMLSISRRQLYDLLKTNAALRATVVEIPGHRGRLIHAERLRAMVNSLVGQKSDKLSDSGPTTHSEINEIG